ncbi:MAG: hypothetical protein COB01_04310 [Lutibacter sp.]|nr:MAG: hypothetical protein COB01_04310 [Lutibacter sp.]
MKKVLLLIAVVLLGSSTIAQEKTYLVFEFMRVDNNQENAYQETESFWEKIHKQRVKNGDIVGWDLWSLKPGGEDQGFQYMTVNVYNDPVKMFNSEGDFQAALNAAFPDLSEKELQEQFNKTSKSRDLAVRLYLEIVKGTTGDFKMDVGTVASIDFMKATNGSGAYESAEIETFLPMHQKAVDAGEKGSWDLCRIMSPMGSDAYATHLTVNMYTGYNQYFKSQQAMWETPPSDEDSQKIEKGIATRDMKWVSLATLIKKVR